MDDTDLVATLMQSTSSKIQQLQQAFAELESYRAMSLNMKWEELEEHFHGLQKSLKKRFDELKDQEMEFALKVTESKKMLEKQEVVVVAKELASLETLQVKRDTILSETFKKSKVSHPEPTTNCLGNHVADNTLEQKSETNTGKVEDIQFNVTPSSELVTLCEEMNAKGLHKFVSDNRKNLNSLREEIPIALKGVPDPFNLVFESLQDFYSGENLVLDGKKDGGLLGMRRTCLMLMESLGQLLTDAVNSSVPENLILSSTVKERAKSIASEWKSKLEVLDIDANSGNSLEAHAFLQLLATFGVASEFDEDDLCKLIPAVSRRRQTPELCRFLGLSHKMPGVIEILMNTGRQIDAVNLAYAFGLTEQFAPVALLKAYLKEVRKVSPVKGGNLSAGAQNELDERELSALKAVIRCIEEHKLEDQYPVDPLQKRVVQLEKAKADKKRVAEAAKPQPKRPRANGSIYAPRAATNFPNKSFYRATPERYSYPYDRQYVYPVEAHHHPPLMGSAPYTTISPTHSTYYGNGYQVQYQVPYLH